MYNFEGTDFSYCWFYWSLYKY